MRRLKISLLCQILAAYIFECSANQNSLHEIVYPKIWYKDIDRRIRRSATDEDKSKVNVQFNALGRSFQAHLLLNKRLLAPNFHVEVVGKNGHSESNYQTENCFYTGRLDKENNSLVSLTTCKGLNGVIQTSTGKFTIEPLLSHKKSNLSNQAHIVKRLSDDLHDESHKNGDEVLKDFFKYSDIEKANSTKLDGFCGLVEKPHMRWVRSIMSEKLGEQTIETMLTVDQKMMQYYGLDAARQYALTLANIAHGILRDSTIGPNTINLVIIKLLILTAPLDDLNINHHAANTLLSFGRWSDKRNYVNAGNPDHYDYAVLLTKHDICVDMNQPCETKGLTFVGGMCDHTRSAAVIEDNGFASGYTLAHQTGHSLGMDHDGTGNTCDNSHYVMSRDGGKGEDAFHWSPCSIDYLQQFLRKSQSQCLENDPPSFRNEDIGIFSNPGTVYDTDTQCQYALGPQAKACTTAELEQVCHELLCYHPSNTSCLQMSSPVLDGTACGSNQWCKSGQCVKIGIASTFVVDGGWAQWSEFQECSRSCGGGIAYRERRCEAPKPMKGGKYCEGEARMYAVCNKEPCANGTNYRKIQCENKGQTFVGDQKYTWTYNNIMQESSCNLKCISLDGVMSQDFGFVVDGTECIALNVFGRCIHGECNAVGCDMLLGSTNIIDHCGVCGGDGNLCKDMINLSNNPLVVSRSILNKDVLKKPNEEDAGNKNRLNFQPKYLQLKAIMDEIAKKKCGNNEECIKNQVISRRTVIQPEQNTFNWVSRSLGCSVSCGTGTEIFQPECQRSDDGSAVSNNFCNQATKPSVVFKACGSSACLPRWSEAAWSDCTKSCGGGTKVRAVDCLLQKDNDVYVLPTTECNKTERPRHLETCNLMPCPPEWFAEPYGPCSTVCGKGLRTRSIVCRSANKLEKKWIVHPNDACSNLTIPETEMICNAHNPCPGDGSCGGRWIEKRGTITSPGFPGLYSSNQQCMYEINVSPGKIIVLKFLQMDIVTSSLVCNKNFLRVLDGRCEDQGRPSVEFCGKQLPPNYISTSENLCLKFVTDIGMSAHGFIVNYTEVDNHRHLVTDICDIKDQVLTVPLGVLTSPNYPREYPTNENCRVTFTSPDQSSYLLKMSVFDVGTKRRSDSSCKNDYIELFYDEKSEQFCGKASQTIRIPSTEFTLNFHSSARKSYGKGFVFTYATEKFASENGLGTSERFKDFPVEFLGLQQKYPPMNNFSLFKISSLPTFVPNVEVKKSVIPMHTEDERAINDPSELTKVLQSLATIDSSKFSYSHNQKPAKLNDWSMVVKKSSIPRPPVSDNTRILNSEDFLRSLPVITDHSPVISTPINSKSIDSVLNSFSPPTYENNFSNRIPYNFKLTDRNNVPDTLPYIFSPRRSLLGLVNTFPTPTIIPSRYSSGPYLSSQVNLGHKIFPAANVFSLPTSQTKGFLLYNKQKSYDPNVIPYLNQVNFYANQPYFFDRFFSRPSISQNNFENIVPIVSSSYPSSFSNYKSTVASKSFIGIPLHINSRSAPSGLPSLQTSVHNIENNRLNMPPLNPGKVLKTAHNYEPQLERSTILKPDNQRRPKFSYTIDSTTLSDDLSMFGDRDSPSVESTYLPMYDGELEKRTLHPTATIGDKHISNKLWTPDKYSQRTILPGGDIPLSKLTLNDVLSIEAKTNRLITKLAGKSSITPSDLSLYKIVNNKNILVRFPYKRDKAQRVANFDPRRINLVSPVNQNKATFRINTAPSKNSFGKQSASYSLQNMLNQTKVSHKDRSPNGEGGILKRVAYLHAHDWENQNLGHKEPGSNLPVDYKRQYQSLPFQFEPSISIFNNKCPPKETISCRAVISHISCSHDSECLDLRLGCCQTSCVQQEYVCI